MLLFLFVFPHITSAEEMVTVQLVNYVEDTSSLHFELEGSFFTLDPTVALKEGVRYTLSVVDGSLILEGNNETFNLDQSFILVPETYNKNHLIHIDDRPYLGAMEWRIEDNEYLRPVNQLPLEDYLKGVVPFEVYPSWGLETLKAQAVAARTYAASHLREEIDDTISYQVYGGYTWSEATTRAVEETKGKVITFDNKLISAFYSASNGGVTENNTHVWGGEAKSYFPIKQDPYDPIHPWEFILHQTQIDMEEINWEDPNWWDKIEEKDLEITTSIKKRLVKNGYPGDLKILSIPEFKVDNDRLESQRSVKGSITIEFFQRIIDGTVLFRQLKLEDVDLNQIRPLIGGNQFKSYLIDSLEASKGVYKVKGRGYGHGVGMSQWGANFMGEQGKSYQDIIEFYFPGTTITTFTE